VQLRCSRSRSVGVAAPATPLSRIYALPAKAREWWSWGRRPEAVDAVRHPVIELSPTAGNVDAPRENASRLEAGGSEKAKNLCPGFDRGSLGRLRLNQIPHRTWRRPEATF